MSEVEPGVHIGEIDAVPIDEVEIWVQMKRRRLQHLGRAVSCEQKIFILHSQECLDSEVGPLGCEFTEALKVDSMDLIAVQDLTFVLGIDERGALKRLTLA